MKYYFTFGSGHHDTSGRSLAKYYIVFEADDAMTARAEMFSYFGPKWASQYDEVGFAGQAEKYGYEQLWPDDVDLCCGIEQRVMLTKQGGIPDNE